MKIGREAGVILQRCAQFSTVGRIEFPPVEIRQQIKNYFVLIFLYDRIEQHSAFKCVFRQHTLAETVNRGDRAAVEINESVPEASDQRFAGRILCRMFHNRLDAWTFLFRYRGTRRIVQGIAEHVTDSCPQFGGRRFGESDDKDAADRDVLFQYEAQDEVLDIVSLARSRRRLDHADAVQGAGRGIQHGDVRIHISPPGAGTGGRPSGQAPRIPP